MSDLLDKVKALVAALPAQLAVVQAVLVSLGIVVPLLPVAWQAKAAAVLVAVGGWVAAVVRVVGSVTPVPAGAEGLLLPVDRELSVELRRPSGAVVSAITSTR